MSFKALLSVVVVFGSASVFAAATATTTTAAKTTATTTTAPAATTANVMLPKADAKAVDYSVITLADAKKAETFTVKGPVVETYCDTNICALNFHTDFRKYVSIIIEKKDFVNFASIPGTDMKAKMEWYKTKGAVQVTGKVQEYTGKSGSRPQIHATMPTDIKPIAL